MHIVFLIHVPSLTALDFPSGITCKIWSSVLCPLTQPISPCAIQADRWHRLTVSKNDSLGFSRLSVSQMHTYSSTTAILQHMLFFFLRVSWCDHTGPLGQVLQLFGMVFWTHGKPKSDYKFGRQIQDIAKNAPDLQFVWRAIKISTYVPRK